jgi:hypothetical protein
MPRRLRIAWATLAALTLLAPPLALAAEPEATVTCKDGSTSKAGRGACHGHGGVAPSAAARTGAVPPGGAAATPAGPAPHASASAAPPPAPRTTTAPVPKTGGGAADATAAPAARAPSAPAPPSTGPTRQAQAAPAGNTAAPGATARCKDGTLSHAQHHSGACSQHGGVAEWLDGSTK